MPWIFVGYRRRDSQRAAGRLVDSRREEPPGMQTHRDVQTIRPGVGFIETVGRTPPYAGGPPGHWPDAACGRNRLARQGTQVDPQGMSPHGPLVGVGELQGNRLALHYSLNDAADQAVLYLAAHGRLLQGQYRDPRTGETGPVSLMRLP